MWLPPRLGNDTALLQPSGCMAYSLISKCRKSGSGFVFVVKFRVGRDDRLVDLSVIFQMKQE